MGELLSPGVLVQEIDHSTIAPSVAGTSVAFAGNFTKGFVDTAVLVTSYQEFVDNFGKPTKSNFNDWYQVYNFLQYGNKIYVSRACDLNGTLKETGLQFVSKQSELKDTIIPYDIKFKSVSGKDVVFEIKGENLPQPNEEISIEGVPSKVIAKTISNDTEYKITFNVDMESKNLTESSVFNKVIPAKQLHGNIASFKGTNVFEIGNKFAFSNEVTDHKYEIQTIDTQVQNGVNFVVVTYKETEDDEFVIPDTILANAPVYKLNFTQNALAEIPGSSYTGSAYDIKEYDKQDHIITNQAVFEDSATIPFAFETSKVKVIAKYPGLDGNYIDVAIANPEDFKKGKFVKDGIALDDLFEYYPSAGTFGLIVLYKNQVQEVYTLSLDENSKDSNNKSNYIESINRTSSYIYVKVNEANQDKSIKSSLDKEIIKLTNGTESEPGLDDINNAYKVFENAEEIDIDILIANEKNPSSAINIAELRKDCVAIVGCPFETSVGLKANQATSKSVQFRNDLNVNSSYIFLVSNYKYQYLNEMDAYKWVNFAGDVAGLVVQSTETREAWYAPAGLNRGLLKNVKKIAFSPSQGQRDTLYKSGINPITIFTGQGCVLWGQKTLLDKPSSFDRLNVRRLFLVLEKSLSKMSKYSLFEFNDSFTRNYITSTINPYLATIKAGRGVQDYLVICDESNNTPDIISRNKLVIDIYIKPTYVAEFIHLHFINSGTSDFKIITSSN